MKFRPAIGFLLIGILSVTIFSCKSFKPYESTNNAALTFVQLCDTQLGMGGYEHDIISFKSAVAQINKLQPDFVVICGDLVHHASDSSYADFLAIEKQFKIPCYVAPGNHDVSKEPTKKKLYYYRKTIGSDYYKFTVKEHTFLVTNTQLWKADVKEESIKHQKWFEENITSTQNKTSFVIGHYPLYTEFPTEEEHYFNLPLDKRNKILKLLEENNVKAYLSGHTHKLVVNDYKGIAMVSGETTSKNFDTSPLGFRYWTVTEDRLDHKFIPLNTHKLDKAE